MKQLLIKAILGLCAKSAALAAVAACIIGILGYINKWDSSITYSNAFFVAGCLVIIAGGTSRLGASQELSKFQLLYAESFRDMNMMQRASFILDASSPVRLVIIGLLSGISLILISLLVAKMF